MFVLYKNLPKDELCRVMCVRALLDYVAAFKFLATFDIPNFRAVLKARKEYQRMRPDFVPQRMENLQKTVNATLPERMSFSILWQFYARGKKLFSEL